MAPNPTAMARPSPWEAPVTKTTRLSDDPLDST